MFESTLLALTLLVAPQDAAKELDVDKFAAWLTAQCQLHRIELPVLAGEGARLDTGGIAAVAFLTADREDPLIWHAMPVPANDVAPPRAPPLPGVVDPGETILEKVEVHLDHEDGELVTKVGPVRLTEERKLDQLCKRIVKGNPEARFILYPTEGITHQEAVTALDTVLSCSGEVTSVAGHPSSQRGAVVLAESLARYDFDFARPAGDVLVVLDARRPFTDAQDILTGLAGLRCARVSFAALDGEGKPCKLIQHLPSDLEALPEEEPIEEDGEDR